MARDLGSLTGRVILAGGSLLVGGSAAAQEHEAGLPQLDPSGFMPQLIWLAISFTLLYFIMSRVALPRIARVLDARDWQIQSDLERAEKLKAEADEALRTYEQAMSDARAKAQAQMRKASEAVAAEAAAREGELAAKLASQSETAERAIAAAKQAALADVAKVASELAASMAAKLTGAEARAAAEAAVAEVMQERR